MPRPEEIAPNPKRPARFYPCRAFFTVLNSENHSFSMAESSISRRMPGFPLPYPGLYKYMAHKEARNIGLAALIIRHSLGVVRQNAEFFDLCPSAPESLI